jgi:hypothetical protein
MAKMISKSDGQPTVLYRAPRKPSRHRRLYAVRRHIILLQSLLRAAAAAADSCARWSDVLRLGVDRVGDFRRHQDAERSRRRDRHRCHDSGWCTAGAEQTDTYRHPGQCSLSGEQLQAVKNALVLAGLTARNMTACGYHSITLGDVLSAV